MSSELLSPAGNLEKLKLAIDYGADAVYIGLQKFGLRSAAENFSCDELFEGTAYAHDRNAKVYVVLNAYLHDKELSELPEYLKIMSQAKVDAVIVSDLGVIKTVKNNSEIPVHLSTQASCLNRYSAKAWKELGAERLVLGREISLKEAKAIKDYADIELEMFVHGSMCMAFSGNCVISNYTQGRDSNRGGCAHSCRFEYSLDVPGKKSEQKNSFFMSSKDLNGISFLKEYKEAGIDSLKVEGRMKNHLYLATVTGAYRKALDALEASGELSQELIKTLDKDLETLANRGYTPASLLESAGEDSISRDIDRPSGGHQIVGKLLKREGSKLFFLAKAKLYKNDSIEIVDPVNCNPELTYESLFDLTGKPMDETKPNRIYYIHNTSGIMSQAHATVLRRRI